MIGHFAATIIFASNQTRFYGNAVTSGRVDEMKFGVVFFVRHECVEKQLFVFC